MEVPGLAVGIAGLAGLFSACVDCFELVQRGRYLGKDYHLLETKFNNQWRRLTTWGRPCGLPHKEEYAARIFQDEEVRSGVEYTLLQLLVLFQDGDHLNRRYGLTKAAQTEPEAAVLLPSDNRAAARRAAVSMLGRRIRELKDGMTPSSMLTGYGISKRAKWAVQDKEKFTELIQHMRDLIEDLEGITASLGAQERQREFIKHDMESISDVPALESMEEARAGRIDTVSDAATFRLWYVRDSPQSAISKEPNTHGHEHTSTATEGGWEILAESILTQTPGDVHFQLLHRVHCDLSQTSVFFDVPDYTCSEGISGEWVFLNKDLPSNSSRSFHLCGKRPLRDLKFPYYWHYHLRSHVVQPKSASVRTFLDFIEQSMRAEYKEVDNQRKRKVVSWGRLPYLFVYGDTVIQRNPAGLHAYQAYRIIQEPMFTQEDTGDMQMHFEVNERLMVDIPLYWKLEAKSRAAGYPSSEVVEVSTLSSKPILADIEPLSGDMFPLAPPTVFAFDLKAHKWRQIYIDRIQMIAWNTSAVRGLMRDIEEEEILQSLCRPSTRGSSSVVLFHGPPGNRKTVAAEAVAEFAKKPLFRIAPHELGSTVKDFQDFINPTLVLTRSWDCVLLLEQFDIYLESRATNDVTRDWIVAEFKRLRDNF
ncbi:uncharacterized protein PG986_005897 [Apiospora aurea]|uniref:Prion-inhibition and propagation HeLo domain-containing protein n=1 Tax=Apiospora aurea TaxID=335848 RepID=A0ABR1QIV0_9PEZI